MTLRDSVRRLAVRLGLASTGVRTGPEAILGTVAEDDSPTETLVDAEVLRPVGDGHVLVDEFGDRWLDSMAPFRDATPEQIADGIRGVRPDATVGVEDRDGRPTLVVTDGWDGGTLELSRAAAIADVAAVNTLAGSDVAPPARLACLPLLRQHLDECPDCEATLVEEPDVDGGSTVRKCPDCRAELARS
ncbi:hypothetical protein [Haloarchaeobius iranensis]|uniref:DUF8054 domain-containing protein n=1 Tax=Haloarchaeobius iranensis TaxID=996166 RepID=A0A1G9UCY8_9EURY|nr:hypothetical protein [Haloarchaeobius iranensis]SDM57780.1 hypothetical protein SAMN05192554_10463 [Haloarchaeobius iranensis]